VNQLGHLLQRHRRRQNQFMPAGESKTKRLGGGRMNSEIRNNLIDRIERLFQIKWRPTP
jgi:3'-phosphoadenosine 5'-phosphosulfate sulfotransferase